MDKYQNKYRIPTARATWHAYDGGLYFVTVCTKDREHYFGEISDGKMQLSETGRYLDDAIQSVSQHNAYAEIPLYVIMPNHIHLIVAINNDDCDNCDGCRDVACYVSTGTGTGTGTGIKHKNAAMSQRSPKRGTLSVTVRGIKSATTHYARQNGIPFAWQSRFHDRIIRSQNECNRIAEYIENNVINWGNDEFNDDCTRMYQNVCQILFDTPSF